MSGAVLLGTSQVPFKHLSLKPERKGRSAAMHEGSDLLQGYFKQKRPDLQPKHPSKAAGDQIEPAPEKRHVAPMLFTPEPVPGGERHEVNLRHEHWTS